MAEMAGVLKKHIVEHKLYTPIRDKNYVHVEGWTFAGGLMGLFPKIKDVEDLSKTGEIKWKATAEIINMKTGEVVGVGIALCSNKESKKKTFDEYAVLSMAQTRAIGKAYRNLIGWVMKLTGYESTPSEEMHKVGERQVEPVDSMPVIDLDKDTKPKRGQVVGPDGKPTYTCAKCDALLDSKVAAYSQKIYKKRLCRNCQPKKKA